MNANLARIFPTRGRQLEPWESGGLRSPLNPRNSEFPTLAQYMPAEAVAWSRRSGEVGLRLGLRTDGCTGSELWGLQIAPSCSKWSMAQGSRHVCVCVCGKPVLKEVIVKFFVW